MRELLIRDIVNHQIEETEVGGGGYMSPEDITDEITSLQEMTTDDLEQFWFGTVGEWVESMTRWNNDEFWVSDECPVWEDNGFESVSEWQYSKLTNGQNTDYGYISPLSEDAI